MASAIKQRKRKISAQRRKQISKIIKQHEKQRWRNGGIISKQQ